MKRLRQPLVFAFFALTLIFIGGCGSDDSSDPPEKNLFSSWASTESAFVLDLTNGDFGTFLMSWVFEDGAMCVSNLTIGGTQNQGNGVVSGSTYVTGTGSSTDPGCASLNASYTYTKTADVLTICNSSTGECGTYI